MCVSSKTARCLLRSGPAIARSLTFPFQGAGHLQCSICKGELIIGPSNQLFF